jgi:DNA polymerase-3 subunit gamma/tau
VSISAPPIDGLHLEAMVDAWPRIRADVKAVNRRIEALLQQIDPVAIAGNRVTLVSPYEFHRNRVNTDEVRLVIEEVISRIFKEKVTVSCVTRDEATTLAPSQPAPRPVAEPVAASRPEPSPVNEPVKAPPSAPEAEPAPSFEDDERTFQAVKNIFDAEEEDQ